MEHFLKALFQTMSFNISQEYDLSSFFPLQSYKVDILVKEQGYAEPVVNGLLCVGDPDHLSVASSPSLNDVMPWMVKFMRMYR